MTASMITLAHISDIHLSPMPEIGLRDIYRSIVPFVLVMVVALAIVMAFPEIALWLPEQVYGR